jgi:hypothetical protein
MQPLPTTPFTMHQLLVALPDPMFLESTLPMPTAPIVASLLTGSLDTPTEQVVGPDGDVRLPADPFHGYDGPSTFGPGTE